MNYIRPIVIVFFTALIMCAFSCGKDFSDADIIIPPGTAILYADKEYVFQIDTLFSFVGINSPRRIQKIFGSFTQYSKDSSFYKSYSLNIIPFWDFIEGKSKGRVGYGHIIDGHQRGEEYELVPYTKVLELIDFSEEEQRLYIKFGGTFVRKDRDTWGLDVPYRVDWYAVVHSHYRIQ
jgi:hypothetical protein